MVAFSISCVQKLIFNTNETSSHGVASPTLSARANRTSVGVDGDYFSKPSREDIFAAAYAIQRERRPDRFPSLDIQLES